MRKPRENQWAYIPWSPDDHHVSVYPIGSRHANAKQCRAFAAWLLRAADWLDAQKADRREKP